MPGLLTSLWPRWRPGERLSFPKRLSVKAQTLAHDLTSKDWAEGDPGKCLFTLVHLQELFVEYPSCFLPFVGCCGEVEKPKFCGFVERAAFCKNWEVSVSSKNKKAPGHGLRFHCEEALSPLLEESPSPGTTGPCQPLHSSASQLG